MDATIQPTSYPLSIHQIQLGEKDAGDYPVKGFTEIHNICISSLVYWYSHFIIERQWVDQAGLAFDEAMLAVSNHIPTVHVS